MLYKYGYKLLSHWRQRWLMELGSWVKPLCGRSVLLWIPFSALAPCVALPPTSL